MNPEYISSLTIYSGNKGIPKNNTKGLRPISAQTQKFGHGGNSSNFYNDQQGGANRARPITAANNRGFGNSNDNTRNIPNNVIEELEAEEEARLIEKVAYGEGLQIQDVQKLMPKNIHVEKEKLYEDTLHLKQTINNIKEENLKLKTKNLNLERENAKMVKAMEKMGSYTTQYGKQPESALIVALKKQVKDMKEEIKIRSDELEVMKRSTKFTKVQELEIELKAYMEENIRLKNAFEELQRAKPEIKAEDYNLLEERYFMQANLIESLQRDHARLGADLKYLEEENYNFQVAKESDAKTIQTQKTEINKLKKQLREKDQKPVVGGTAYRALGKTEDKSKGDIDENEIRRIQEQVSQKDKIIEDLKQKLEKKGAGDNKEGSNNELARVKEQYAELESRYRALLNVHYPAEEKKRGSERPTSGYNDSHSASTNINELKNKKLKKVSLQDVKDIGYELSLKLRLRHIPLTSVLKSFERQGQRVSIVDLKNMFTQEPYKIRDESATLAARFVVEPQEEDTITFDPNLTQDLATVKNQFKKLVGNYTLWDEDEIKEIVEELGEIISTYEESLKTQFMLIPEAKTGYLSSEQIAKAFESLDIELSDKQLEFLIMNLFEYSNNLKRLDFMKIFEIFESEENKRMKKIIDMYQNQEEQDSERSDRKVKFKEEKGGFANRPQSAGHNKQRQYKEEEEEEDYEDEYAEEDDNEYGDEDYEDDEDHAKK